MGENHFQKNPVALYGVVLLMAAVAFKILANCILKNEGEESTLGRAYRNDFKGNVSMVIYIAGAGLAFFYPVMSVGLYIVVAGSWLVPDKRIEKILK